MSYLDTAAGQAVIRAEEKQNARDQHNDRETALQQCSQNAAEEIEGYILTEKPSVDGLAAIIYKHMRLGREL